MWKKINPRARALIFSAIVTAGIWVFLQTCAKPIFNYFIGTLSAEVTPSPVIVEEEDGSPRKVPTKIKFANGALTDNSDGSVSVAAAAGAGDMTKATEGVAIANDTTTLAGSITTLSNSTTTLANSITTLSNSTTTLNNVKASTTTPTFEGTATFNGDIESTGTITAPRFVATEGGNSEVEGIDITYGFHSNTGTVDGAFAAGSINTGQGAAEVYPNEDFSATFSSGAADANGYNVYPLQDFCYTVTFSTYYITCSTGTASITTYVDYSTNSAVNVTGQTTFTDAAITASSTTYTGGAFTASGIVAAGRRLTVKISGMAADAVVHITGVFARN